MRLIGLADDAMAEAGAERTLGVPEGPAAFGFADPAEFAALLTQAGFEDVDVRTVAFTHRARSAAELWDGLLGGTVRTTEQMKAQPPAVRERVRDAFARRVEAHRAPDGALAVPVAAVLATARRP